jgi:hypothetical protein
MLNFRALPALEQQQESGPYAVRKWFLMINVALVLMFTIYVRSLASNSNNWSSTRKIGFSAINLCTENTYEYSVMNNVTVSVGQDQILVMASCVYMRYGSVRYICLGDINTIEYIADPLNANIYQNYNLMEKIFPSRMMTEKLFPYDIHIVFLACFLLVTELMLERPSSQQLVAVNRTTTRRINAVLGICIGILLLFSSQHFGFIHAEYCDPNTVPDFYCEDLVNNGLDVKSVINPPELIIQKYNTISLLLSCMMLFSTVLRSALPEESPGAVYAEESPQSIMRIHVRNRNRNNRAGDPGYIDSLVAFLYGQQNRRGIEEGEDHIETIELPSTENWKFSRFSPDPSVSECAICLGRFPVAPDITVDDLDEVPSANVRNKPGDIASAEEGVSPAVVPTASSASSSSVNEALTPRNTLRPEIAVAQIPCGHIFHRTCLLNWTLETATRDREYRVNCFYLFCYVVTDIVGSKMIL